MPVSKYGFARHTSYIYIPLMFVLSLLGLAACSHDKPKPKKETTRLTVMVYMAAENSLAIGAYDKSDIEEMMLGAGSIPSDCRMLVLWDTRSLPPRIYEIKATGDTVRLYEYPEMCSAEPSFMADALGRMRDFAPADRYGLIVWSHASGWLPGSHTSHSRSVAQDDNYRTGGRCKMAVEELSEVLNRTSLHPDYIMFDACMMQSVEAVYELRNVTDYIIASPAEIPARGATYNKIMPHLFSNPFNASALARKYFECEQEYREKHECGGVVISAVKTSELDSLAAATRQLLDGSPLQPNRAQPYWLFGGETNSCQFPDFLDMLGVLSAFSNRQAYNAWAEQLKRAVPYYSATKYWDTVSEALYKWAGRSGAGKIDDALLHSGISIFVPQEKYDEEGKNWNRDIRQTAWWKAVYE